MFWGGIKMSRQNDADKVLFSTDTRTTLAVAFAVPPYYHTGFANRGTAGYIHGGTGANSEISGRNTKMPFSTETFSILGLLNITSGEAKIGSSSYDQRFAVMAGGETPGRADWISIFTYSTETESILSAKLTNGRRDCNNLDDCGAY
jgi:hypothetical protein